MTLNIDWENLGFEYMNLPYRFMPALRMVNGMREV